MKISVIKIQGAGFICASDEDAEKSNRFKNGEQYEADFKLTRNPQFHRKVFAFMQFCFNYWQNENDYQSERTSFDVFRANLSVLAGYSEKYYSIDGSVRVEAKSLSYGNLSQDDFEEFYSAIIKAAIGTIFQDADENTINQLYNFF